MMKLLQAVKLKTLIVNKDAELRLRPLMTAKKPNEAFNNCQFKNVFIANFSKLLSYIFLYSNFYLKINTFCLFADFS